MIMQKFIEGHIIIIFIKLSETALKFFFSLNFSHTYFRVRWCFGRKWVIGYYATEIQGHMLNITGSI
jgi:hypothetical protein